MKKFLLYIIILLCLITLHLLLNHSTITTLLYNMTTIDREFSDGNNDRCNSLSLIHQFLIIILFFFFFLLLILLLLLLLCRLNIIAADIQLNKFLKMSPTNENHQGKLFLSKLNILSHHLRFVLIN